MFVFGARLKQSKRHLLDESIKKSAIVSRDDAIALQLLARASRKVSAKVTARRASVIALFIKSGGEFISRRRFNCLTSEDAFACCSSAQTLKQIYLHVEPSSLRDSRELQLRVKNEKRAKRFTAQIHASRRLAVAQLSLRNAVLADGRSNESHCSCARVCIYTFLGLFCVC